MACKIFDGLFIGDAESSQDSEFIELNKISYVINTAGRQLPNLYELHGIRYLTYPWNDSPDFQVFDANGVVVMQLASFIDEALDAGEAVLCHSLNGVSRCSLCMVAYMMYKYWWSLEKSFEFLCSKRPDLAPNAGFLQQLQIVDTQLQAARRTILESNKAPISQLLKNCKLSKRSPLPSPQFASSILNSNNKKLDKKAEIILASKLFEWDPTFVREYNNLVGEDNFEELVLTNSLINSRSDLTSFPGPGDRNEHIATRLRWTDNSADSGAPTVSRVGSAGSHRRNQSAAPGNIIARVNKGTIERPPNTEYSTFQLGAGWVDREKKMASPVVYNPKRVRSILKGGVQKMKQQHDAFAAAAQFDGSMSNNNKIASPEQRLNSMVKQFQEERNSPTFDLSQNNNPNQQKQQIKVARGTGRVGGLRDSIILAREHLTHDHAHDENKNLSNSNDIMAAATLAASTLSLGGLEMQQQKLQSSNSSLSQKHDLSPANIGGGGKSLEQIDVQRQRAAQQLQHEYFNADASISSNSTPSVSILPSFLLSQNPFADNSSLGSLSSMGSPIHRPMSAQAPPTMSLNQQLPVKNTKRPGSAGSVTETKQRRQKGTKKQQQKQQQQKQQQQQQQQQQGWANHPYNYSASMGTQTRVGEGEGERQLCGSQSGGRGARD
ncbi:hypothetical protein TL16_g02402 [Triparma laevis f. inornata]|uniref:Tyrosine-protein phosphatase domain-containing protein n=1 Tax=Triparma laevis f. inornata TaxID=1714386 RepID=A0A9W6ZQM9_9STRA|nr:hypothetical protein TL16_g02402 [Triparma laevis f. inornata]